MEKKREEETKRELKNRIASLKSSLQSKQKEITTLRDSKSNIEVEFTMALRNAQDALSLSQRKDVQVEDLGLWLTNTNQLLKNVLDVESIDVKDGGLEILYSTTPHSSLHISLNRSQISKITVRSG